MLRHTLILLALLATSLQAQQLPVATGGDAAGTGGSISYSVGQPAYTAPSAATGTVAQGVQQPYEISVTTGIDGQAAAFSLTAGPNPATDALELIVTGALPDHTGYNLRNAAGKLIAGDRIAGQRTRIAMNGLPTGVYLLEVTAPGGPIRSFRIAKH